MAALRRTLGITVLLCALIRPVWPLSLHTGGSSTKASADSTMQQQRHPVGSILIMDHLNINHEKGRHDWLKAFYFDFLKCSVDPRKEENIVKGSGTVWANLGANTNLHGIARFYESVLDAPILDVSERKCVVSVGPRQTLSFVPHPREEAVVAHEDLRDDQVEPPPGQPRFLSNYGPHISIYVSDLPELYRRADELGLAYVNPRFKRRAYTMDEAIDDCMFRCLDIKDPLKPEAGVLLRLEHEVRSVVKRDGTKYKSCPFSEIPEVCLDSAPQ